jgi:hypothetical protein
MPKRRSKETWVASVRQVVAETAQRAAVEKLLFVGAERPWQEWGRAPVVAELLTVAGEERDVLRRGVEPALMRFLRSRDPVEGLACVYLVQALVVAELEQAEAAPCT